MTNLKGHKGILWQWDETSDRPKLLVHRSGLIVFADDGTIVFSGNANDVTPELKFNLTDHGDKHILPGFVDAHLHMPQLDMIGSYGHSLLDWLKNYTFPMESGFSDKAIAESTAERLTTELFAHGITTAVIFASSHEVSADAMFGVAENRGLRAAIGKVSMDRNAIDSLHSPLAEDLAATQRLISKWHRKNPRLTYALTPRFAPTCSSELLKALGDLKDEHQDLIVQTHLNETEDEIKWVKQLFGQPKDYLAVYEDHGLLGSNTLLAHGIHSSKSEQERIAKTGATVVHCPTSNLFLGSGLYPLKSYDQAGVRSALASDVGAGTTLCPWATMRAAYQVQSLQELQMTTERLFELATLSGGSSLAGPEKTGRLSVGSRADFQILDPSRHRLLSHRLQKDDSLETCLGNFLALADDRIVEQVYIDGQKVYNIK